MITLKKPSELTVREYLASLTNAPFNYDTIGCVTRGTPEGFIRDESVFEIGYGNRVFERACEAIRNWVHFPEELVSLVRTTDDITAGTTVGVVCYAAGLWTVSPARILTHHDEDCDGIQQFGFTYGTLNGHMERGEERFRVELDLDTGRVVYRITAVSRPSHPLCWIAYPYTRMMQAKFRRLSGKAMVDFVNQSSVQTNAPRQLIEA